MMLVDNEVLYIGRMIIDDLRKIHLIQKQKKEKIMNLPGKRLDGVNDVVVVVVTDERSEAVGVTIVAHDEVIDGYFVFVVVVDKELHNGKLSFAVIIESDGEINFDNDDDDDSFNTRVISSFPLQFIVDCE